MPIRTKRVYESPSVDDGQRVLVDRVWPRGVSTADAKIDFWAKQIAPSDDLRKWYRHEGRKWAEFKRRYFAELDADREGVAELRRRIGTRAATFVYGSKETEFNNATALVEYLEA